MLGRTWGMRVLLDEAFEPYCARDKGLAHVAASRFSRGHFCNRKKGSSRRPSRGSGVSSFLFASFVRNGAIADVAAVLHQVPMYRVHQIVGLSLRGGDAVAQTDGAQHPTAGSEDLTAIACIGSRAGVKYL